MQLVTEEHFYEVVPRESNTTIGMLLQRLEVPEIMYW